jgi:hypothetical protein
VTTVSSSSAIFLAQTETKEIILLWTYRYDFRRDGDLEEIQVCSGLSGLQSCSRTQFQTRKRRHADGRWDSAKCKITCHVYCHPFEMSKDLQNGAVNENVKTTMLLCSKYILSILIAFISVTLQQIILLTKIKFFNTAILVSKTLIFVILFEVKIWDHISKRIFFLLPTHRNQKLREPLFNRSRPLSRQFFAISYPQAYMSWAQCPFIKQATSQHDRHFSYF